MIDIYSPENWQLGKIIVLLNWYIMPIPLQHNIECFGYLIYNKIENKTIVYATDTTSLPSIADHSFDLMMLECNYSFDKVIQNARKGHIVHNGYRNHMALENLTQWLSTRECKPKNLMVIHLSEHGNLDKELMVEQLTPLADKFYIAKKGVEIEI